MRQPSKTMTHAEFEEWWARLDGRERLKQIRAVQKESWVADWLLKYARTHRPPERVFLITKEDYRGFWKAIEAVRKANVGGEKGD
ncbi:MAG: hypothetical protein AB1760_00085 [Pseudomonadota bacterium]